MAVEDKSRAGIPERQFCGARFSCRSQAHPLQTSLVVIAVANKQIYHSIATDKQLDVAFISPCLY